MLEPPRSAAAIPQGTPDAARIPELPMPEFRRSAAVETATPPRQAAPSTTIAGSSLLGLDTVSERKPVNDDALDSLRDRSFSGLDYFYEPEEKGVSGRQILLLLVLLGALGAAGWWTYKNYLGAVSHPAKPVAANPASESPADNSAAKTDSSLPATPEPSSAAPAATSTPSAAPVTSAAQSSAPPPAPPVQVEKPTPPATPAKKEEIVTASRTTPTAAPKPAPARSSRAEVPAEQAAAGESNDNGDAAYRKAEALLYGRGVSANCDEAVKYLKDASAKQNAKARSMFGTMYATGHCVPRDLPTSYSWFALALRVEPNNQILEKDLTAVWNQMTPPERQLAAKTKQ